MRAKVCYKYGFSHKEVSTMPWDIFKDYFISLKGLEAEDILMNIQATTFSDLKKSGRTKLLSTLKRTITNCVNRNDGKLATVQSLAKNLARMAGRGRQ